MFIQLTKRISIEITFTGKSPSYWRPKEPSGNQKRIWAGVFTVQSAFNELFGVLLGPLCIIFGRLK